MHADSEKLLQAYVAGSLAVAMIVCMVVIYLRPGKLALLAGVLG